MSHSSASLSFMGGMESRIRAAARFQFGFVDKADVIESGGSDSLIKHRLQAGVWGNPHPGVYYLNVTEASWEGRVLAALLAAGPNALVSHRTAAVLLGLDGLRTWLIELTVPYSKRPMPEGTVIHRTRRVLPAVSREGLALTTPERTLLDLAALLPEAALEKALMSALRQGHTTPDRIAVTLAEQGGRGVRGTRKLRRTLARVDDGVTGSPSEVDVLALIRNAPLPMPECQYPIRLSSGDNAYPDFAWPDRMKIVEVDGLDAHASADSLHLDLIRQNLLMELGWELRRFSARAVWRNPREVIDEIVRFVGA